MHLEDGYTRIANGILEALAHEPLSGAEMRCVLYLLRQTYGFQLKKRKITYEQFQEGTGLARRTTIRALTGLRKREIVTATPNGHHRPLTWSFQKYVKRWSKGDQSGTLEGDQSGTTKGDQSGTTKGDQSGTLTTKEKERKGKKGGNTPPSAAQNLHSHPAIVAYIETVKRWPSEQYQIAIAEKVKNLETWQTVLDLWKANDYNTGAIDKMLDRYLREAAAPAQPLDAETPITIPRSAFDER